jgi:hypothetical protein
MLEIAGTAFKRRVLVGFNLDVRFPLRIWRPEDDPILTVDFGRR